LVCAQARIRIGAASDPANVYRKGAIVGMGGAMAELWPADSYRLARLAKRIARRYSKKCA